MLTTRPPKPSIREATHNVFDLIREYNVYTNVGINKRGTPMLTRGTTQLTNITMLLSRWGMTAFYWGVCIVSIYEESGLSSRQERKFYIVEIIYIFRSLPPTVIIVKILTAS
jgi:hypothetical protein